MIISLSFINIQEIPLWNKYYQHFYRVSYLQVNAYLCFYFLECVTVTCYIDTCMDQKQLYFTIIPMLQSKWWGGQQGNIKILTIEILIKDMLSLVETFLNKVSLYIYIYIVFVTVYHVEYFRWWYSKTSKGRYDPATIFDFFLSV